MSLKDNFNQALKEILSKDGIVGDDLSKESKKKSELDRYIDPPRPPEPKETVDDIPEYAADETVISSQDTAGGMGTIGGSTGSGGGMNTIGEPAMSAEQPQGSPYVQNSQAASQFGARPSYGQGDPFSRGGSPGFGSVPPIPPAGSGGAVPPPPFADNDADSPYYETEETTIISRNTIINGSIRSFANLNVDGSVKGDVKITKNINVTGKVVGDIECSNSVMTGASMQGNITSKGQVQLDRDTVLLGDIAAQYLDLNGKIKGNIDVGGKAEFKTDAIVLGNITASTITVLDGATIQGYVNTTFLQESTATVFPDAIAVTTE